MTLGFAMSACVYNEELADIADLYPTKQNTVLPYSMITPNKGEKTSSSRSIPNEAFAHVQICIRNEDCPICIQCFLFLIKIRI